VPTILLALTQLMLNGKTFLILLRLRNFSAVSTVPIKDSLLEISIVMPIQSVSSKSTLTISFSSSPLQRTSVYMVSVLDASQLFVEVKRKLRSLNPVSNKLPDQSTLTLLSTVLVLLTSSWETPSLLLCGTKTSRICLDVWIPWDTDW
jgi:hypothetical protein